MTSQEAQRYCADLTKHSGSNFYYSFLFLPKKEREAMYALYAFCLEVDSAVDAPVPGSDPRARLMRWREDLAVLYRSDHPSHETFASPVMACLGGHIRQFSLPQEYFEDIISGVEMDLTLTRYPSFSDLYQYCYRVASVVGLLCLKIFGAREQASHDYAVNLGIAFQLTNILRDVKADGDRGRIYLPQEDLRRFGVSEQEVLAGSWTPEFGRLMEFECGRAREFYRLAETSLPVADRRALLAAEIMRAIYQSLLDRIEAARDQVFRRRITLGALPRMAFALRTWLAYQWQGK
jgi:phytoene synthase